MPNLDLTPEQTRALASMYNAMEDMHQALYTGTRRALEFPYPLYLGPLTDNFPDHLDGHACAYWVQGNWAGETVETYTLDLDTLEVTVRTLEPYVFFALDQDQQVAILTGRVDPVDLSSSSTVEVADVEEYVDDNVAWWADMALQKLNQDLED